ncbi:TIGR04141 family sporadically distributed protein [Pseudarthrobacter sp. NKDBFgelt]|uniref:TIGR04141 family sporadically distributed protein n=1 Tax=Pseudarthrobacter sp. NKDBFgelt TaxID=3384443 RepID=UPI0038D434B3
MKISVYLYRKEADSFGQLLKVVPEGLSGPAELSPKTKLNVPFQAWSVAGREKAPSWAETAAELVDTSSFINVSNSLVLLFEVKTRFFAVCFGHGHSILNAELLEPEFGLRTTVNAVDPYKLAAMQVRTLNENSRQQRSQTSNQASIADLDLDVEREMIRFVRGKVGDSKSLVNSLGGSQAASLTTKAGLKDIPTILAWLLASFESDAYKTSFPYLDNFVPLKKNDAAIKPLVGLLNAAIKNPAGQRIGVASPDDIFGEEPDYYQISGDRKRRDHLEDLTLTDVLNQISESSKANPLEDLKITPFNSGGDPIRTARKLRDYFVFEVIDNKETYVFCLGQWFRIDKDYVKKINNQVRAILDVTSQVGLPIWGKSADGKELGEGDYNETTAKKFQWLLLDKKNFPIGGAYQKVEIADMITDQGDFLCVKRMESSATLSHLFSQAAVSAELYGEDAAGYRAHVSKKFNGQFKSSTLPTNPRMVLAIATEKPGPLADVLFFFSKVNLVQRKRSIERSGFTLALAKIEKK